MNKILHIIRANTASFERIYRILFFVICLSLLITSVIKFGGALNRTKLGFGDLKVRLDHFLHATAYFLFSMYYLAGKFLGLRLFKRRERLFFFILIFLVGFLAEVIQIWVPYRSFSLMDMLANVIGIAVGYFITLIYMKNGSTVRRYDGSNGTTVRRFDGSTV